MFRVKKVRRQCGHSGPSARTRPESTRLAGGGCFLLAWHKALKLNMITEILRSFYSTKSVLAKVGFWVETGMLGLFDPIWLRMQGSK